MLFTNIDLNKFFTKVSLSKTIQEINLFSKN